MATAKTFEDLKIWQDARKLGRAVYAASKSRAFYRDIGSREQIRRAAVSVLSNIAEGFERASRKELIQYLNIAKGSLGEVRSQLCIALDQGYLTRQEFDSLQEQGLILSRQIAAFIRYLQQAPRSPRLNPARKRGREPATCNPQPAT
ncbi:MAG: four helix bundle protein [Verrucomicrobiota bacterium]